MVYWVAFGCNAHTSKNRVTYSSYNFLMQPTLLKNWLAKIMPVNFKPTKHSRAKTYPMTNSIRLMYLRMRESVFDNQFINNINIV